MRVAALVSALSLIALIAIAQTFSENTFSNSAARSRNNELRRLAAKVCGDAHREGDQLNV